MDELNFTGNCLKGSRPILSFDSKFDDTPFYSLMKELFIQVCLYMLIFLCLSFGFT